MNSKPLSLQRCFPGPSPPERRVSKKRRDEAWEALKTEIVRMFRPQLRNLGELFSLRRVYDIKDYQMGILFGRAALRCISWMCWLLPTVEEGPSMFVDAVLAFMFYKLSVVSSELHRSHKSNSLITRLKFRIFLFFKLVFSYTSLLASKGIMWCTK